MRLSATICAIVLALLATGCEGVGKMKEAKSIKINFPADGKGKTVTINNPGEVKSLLDALILDSSRSSRSALLIGRMCVIEFVRADGTSTTVYLNEPKKLYEDRPNGSVEYFLSNSKFYEFVNELVSKAEGRRVDVLRGYCTYGAGRLKDQRTTKIIYTVAHKRKEVTVEPLQGMDLFGELDLTNRKKVDQRDLKPMGLIRYIASDGESMEQVFVTSKQLYEKLDRGAVDYTLKNTKFYDKVNEILSKAEGRKIDVLKDN